jgi:hypothetical protein
VGESDKSVGGAVVKDDLRRPVVSGSRPAVLPVPGTVRTGSLKHICCRQRFVRYLIPVADTVVRRHLPTHAQGTSGTSTTTGTGTVLTN